MPAFQPYWGKPAVRNDRGDRGDVGIIRSSVRASILPDCGGRPVMVVPTANNVDNSAAAQCTEAYGGRLAQGCGANADGTPPLRNPATHLSEHPGERRSHHLK
jgi:hypothetical protein